MPKSRQRKKKQPPKVRIGKRVVTMKPEVEQAMREQRQAFIDKFGREPGPDDPVFFDPDADTPQPFDEKKLAAEVKATMIAADFPPQFIYAFEKTGLMLFAEDLAHCPPDRRAEWRMRSTSISRCRSMTPARTSRSRYYAAPSTDRPCRPAKSYSKNGSAAAPLPIVDRSTRWSCRRSSSDCASLTHNHSFTGNQRFSSTRDSSPGSHELCLNRPRGNAAAFSPAACWRREPMAVTSADTPAVADLERQVVDFTIRVGDALVACRVSLIALADKLGGGRIHTTSVAEATFAEHRAEFERLASLKQLAGLIEPDRSIFIISSDIAGFERSCGAMLRTAN